MEAYTGTISQWITGIAWQVALIRSAGLCVYCPKAGPCALAVFDVE